MLSVEQRFDFNLVHERENAQTAQTFTGFLGEQKGRFRSPISSLFSHRKLTFYWIKMIFTFEKVTKDAKLKGESFRSEKHSWFGVDFVVVLFPKGDKKSLDTHTGLFLECDSKGVEIYAKYSMTIVDQKGSTTNESKSTDNTFKDSTQWGWADFISTSKFFNNSYGFCVKGKVVVEVKLDMPKDMVTQFHSQNWWSKIPELMYDESTTDFNIVIGESIIPVHKIILAAQSPVFRAMFKSSMTEIAENRIVITDVSEEIMRSMLKCMYDCTVVEEEVSLHSKELLTVASKYQLTAIVHLIEQMMIANLSLTNAIELLIFADTSNNDVIKLAAMEFMLVNATVAFNTPNLVQVLGAELCNELFRYLAEAATKKTIGV